ncbi:MT-A70 family protein [Tritrichomonas foetus]|uniref:mRNA m(6)A methyltransferase n=1 Tax=Tritrichomonas foetus TaxID=1144522 RepID=A0A1J4KSY8_9EUKA|nr:MT-A70 family protein [Tritrichomonas foetus]|eukprot:OHT14409.1 MT-A70 family protein [Tritrichomonas foetus]
MAYFGTRKHEKISYDERDPDYIEGICSDDDSILFLPKDKNKRRKVSKEKQKDKEAYSPEFSPPEPKDFIIHQKKTKKRSSVNGPILTGKTHIQQFAPALIQKLIYTTNDSIVYTDPQGNPCPYVPYSEVVKKILRPELLFKGCTNINTLMPVYDPTAPDKLQYFNLDGQLPIFDMNYIHSLSDEDIKEIISMIDSELNEYDFLNIEDCYLVPPFNENLKKSISINANVLDFDWEALGREIQFDVILMDPPWMIQSSKMTRGVELGYDQMKEDHIAAMPLHLVQKNGYVFMWVVAREFSNGLKMLEMWGYQVINSVNWIKTSRRGIYHPSNGYYLQHTKETLLIGVKGSGVSFMRPNKFHDLIVQPRNLRQSHKPNRLYKIIESIFPGGKYLELFARSHNLRNGWVSLGLEVPK